MSRIGASAPLSIPFGSMAFWIGLFLALIYLSDRQCDARAVNVSNTWTMPQEGLNVFYRFFRDRISWFEADAVCQFHHANLVTVDNSFQFDATRDLLRELDVNDIVWVGLMRPQSSEHFMWSNSRPLIADTGYWAESLPLMESPLCAVIDPIRDYRWHALRCGGPETASFLCEMPVPSWADACILRDMPNLTMQYMADTASIELIRNCEEEGQLRQTCSGKEDRERVIRELICPRERLEAQRINDITNSHFKSLQMINSFRTDNNENNDIELVPLEPQYPCSPLSAGHDGTADSQTEHNTVQRLIEQFNVDEMMQADEPARQLIGYNIPGEVAKPVKKGASQKKANGEGPVPVAAADYLKKVNKSELEYPTTFGGHTVPQKPLEQHRFSLDVMMMGDHPHGEHGEIVDGERERNRMEDQASNEIMAPLPHKKKYLPQELRTMPTITVDALKDDSGTPISGESKSEESKEEACVATTTTDAAATTTTTAEVSTTIEPATTASTTTAPQSELITAKLADQQLPLSTDAPTPPQSSPNPATTTTTTTATAGTPATAAAVVATTVSAEATVAPLMGTEPPATIGHPMHPQQPRSNVISAETAHVKDEADNSHFVPPMLLVKTHYVPPSKHHATEHHDQQADLIVGAEDDRNATPTTTPEEVRSDNMERRKDSDMTDIITTMTPTTGTELPSEMPVTDVSNTELLKDLNQQQQLEHVKDVVVESNKPEMTILHPVAAHFNKTSGKTTPTKTSALKPVELQEQRIQLETEAARYSMQPTTTTATPMETTSLAVTTTTASLEIGHIETERPQKRASESEEKKQEKQNDGDKLKTNNLTTTPTTTTTPSIIPRTTTTTQIRTTTTGAEAERRMPESALAIADVGTVMAVDMELRSTTTSTILDDIEPATPTRNFLKDEPDVPFKPNRRRMLTKPETASYFKKILG